MKGYVNILFYVMVSSAFYLYAQKLAKEHMKFNFISYPDYVNIVFLVNNLLSFFLHILPILYQIKVKN